MDMITTSPETLATHGKRMDAGTDLAHCGTCAAPVDLTQTVIIKRNQVVGCPTCDWGALPVTRVANRLPGRVTA